MFCASALGSIPVKIADPDQWWVPSISISKVKVLLSPLYKATCPFVSPASVHPSIVAVQPLIVAVLDSQEPDAPNAVVFATLPFWDNAHFCIFATVLAPFLIAPPTPAAG